MNPSPLSPPVPASRRVLIVDDHEDCLATMVALMAGLGLDVRSARDGPEALFVAREYLPDVVLLDLGLPGLSGYEVAEALRADPRTRDTLIVAVTGCGMRRERELSVQAGIDLHLVKPVPIEQLVEAVFAPRPQASPGRHLQTVLVVDDNPAARYATVRGLGSVGFKVLEAGTGNEALALADQATAMVLDVCLPDIDGRQVCRLLRARPSTARLPIVHLSVVHVTDLDAEEGRRAGGDAYVVSPVYSAGLGRLLDCLIAARGVERAAHT